MSTSQRPKTEAFLVTFVVSCFLVPLTIAVGVFGTAYIALLGGGTLGGYGAGATSPTAWWELPVQLMYWGALLMGDFFTLRSIYRSRRKPC